MMVLVRKDIAIATGVLGGFMIIMGLSIVVCCAMFRAESAHMVKPYWSAVPLTIIGSIGVACAITKSTGLLTAVLIINLMLFLIMLICTGMVAIALGFFVTSLSNHCFTIGNSCYCTTFQGSRTFDGIKCDYLETAVLLIRVILAMSIMGTMGTFASSILGCLGICCCKANEQTVAVILETQPHQQQGVFPNGMITFNPAPQKQSNPPSSAPSNNAHLQTHPPNNAPHHHHHDPTLAPPPYPGPYFDEGEDYPSHQPSNDQMYDPTAQISPAFHLNPYN